MVEMMRKIHDVLLGYWFVRRSDFTQVEVEPCQNFVDWMRVNAVLVLQVGDVLHSLH